MVPSTCTFDHQGSAGLVPKSTQKFYLIHRLSRFSSHFVSIHLADRPVNLLSDRLPIALKVAAHGVPFFDVVHPGEKMEQGLEGE